MYKNKEKQREATKNRVRRYRDKQKGVTSTEGVTIIKTQGMTRDMVVGEGIARKVRAREITRKVIAEGTGMTELKFSKSKQAKGRLSEGI